MYLEKVLPNLLIRSAVKHNIMQQFTSAIIVGSLSSVPNEMLRVGNRSYVRQAVRQIPTAFVKPLDIKTTGKKKIKSPNQNNNNEYQSVEGQGDFSKLSPDLKKQILELEDEGIDVDVNTMHLQYNEYERESQIMYEKQRRLAMTRKHYKPYISKELNLLTFAEKDKIRYLHLHCGWTAEMIAESFPISEFGADKLIKSKFHPKLEKELKNHDEYVVTVLHKIRDGEIELTPELAARMKKRAQLPVFVGAKWLPEEFDSTTGEGGFSMEDKKPERVPGEFERIVIIPPDEPKTQTDQKLLEGSTREVVKQSINYENVRKSKPMSKQPSKPANDQMESFSDIRDVMHNYEGGDDERRFKARNLNPDARLTLNEFQRIFKPEEVHKTRK